MAMRRYWYNKCNRIVHDADGHFCSFYKNEGIVYKHREQDETEKVDINNDETGKVDKNNEETTGNLIENLEDNNRNVGNTSQLIGDASKASTSRVHSVSSIENRELNERSFQDSIDSANRSFEQYASFHSPERMTISDAGADQPLDLSKAAITVQGSSTGAHKTIGPDEVRLYVCDKCTCQCKKKSLFDFHYRKHTGKKNRVCGFCEKRFAKKGDLNRHERTHTGERPYVCEKCGKNFAQKGHLSKHFSTHTEERPFECPIFERRFSDRSDLGRPVSSPGRGPYRFGQCQQVFSCIEEHNRHFMQEHGRRE